MFLYKIRYKIDEDFGTQTSLENIDKMELSIKEKQHNINKREHDKDGKKDGKTEIDELKKELGGLKDSYKKSLREIKVNIGSELFNR
jgi:HAMP domain-containing protein